MEVRGKLLVATDEREVARMHGLHERAEVNGVDAEVVDAAELRRREPHVAGLAALWVPSTAITDYGAITLSLAEDVRREGGTVLTGWGVHAVTETGDRVVLTTHRCGWRSTFAGVGHLLCGHPGRPTRSAGGAPGGLRDGALPW